MRKAQSKSCPKRTRTPAPHGVRLHAFRPPALMQINVARRSPSSMAGSMPRLRHWGTPNVLQISILTFCEGWLLAPVPEVRAYQPTICDRAYAVVPSPWPLAGPRPSSRIALPWCRRLRGGGGAGAIGPNFCKDVAQHSNPRRQWVAIVFDDVVRFPEERFDRVRRSTSRKSGVAMRLPRIHRIRWDEPAHEAHTLQALEKLLM